MQRAARPVYRHSLAVRTSHWLFTAAFFALLGTGALMLLHQAHRFGWNAEAVHRIFAWPMLIAGAVYLAAAIARGGMRAMLLRRADVPKMLPMAQYYLGQRSHPPLHGKYNPLQKAAYTGVIFVVAPLIVITGYAMWSHAPLGHALADALGGRHLVKLGHIAGMVALVAFFVGHMVMVAATGLRANLRAMVTGWHHPHASAPGADLSERSYRPRLRAPQG